MKKSIIITVVLMCAMIFTMISPVLIFYFWPRDFSDWEFEKYQSDFEAVYEIVKSDYEKLEAEKAIYLMTDGNLERLEDNLDTVIVIDSMTKELERVENFRKFVFDGVDAYEDKLVFVYGGQEYIIHTYDGKKPDYNFLKEHDFYTGKLAEGWYVAKLRLR